MRRQHLSGVILLDLIKLQIQGETINDENLSSNTKAGLYGRKPMSSSNNLNHLSSIRKNLRQSAIESPVFNAVKFADDFSDMLWKMWMKYNEK